MQIYETSFLFALTRFVLIAIFFYFLKKVFIGCRKYHFSHFFIINISKYASITIVTVFVLTLFNAYNLFNTLSFLSLFLFFDINNFRNPKIIYSLFTSWLKTFTLKIVHFIEHPNKKQVLTKTSQHIKFYKTEIYDFILVILLIIISFTFRVIFFNNDLFLFSESWFSDFDKINSITAQKWFNVDYVEMGEFALINFFSLFFKVSYGMTLQMFGFLQSIIISILIYWIVKQVNIKHVLFIAVLSSIIFLGGFSISPIDISFLFKHRKAFTILFILLPSLILLSKKQHPHRYQKNLIHIFFSLTATALVSLSSIFLIAIPGLLTFYLYDTTKNRKQKIVPFLLLFSSLSLLFTCFFFLYGYGTFNIIFYIKNSFIDISNFTKIQNLDIPYKKIVNTFSVLATFNILLNTIFSKTNTIAVLISALYLFHAALYHTNYHLIDEIFLLLIFSVLTPVLLGISTLKIILKLVALKNHKLSLITLVLLSITSLFFLIYTQKNILKKVTTSNETNRQILAVYDNIITHHLPFSYAVINHEKAITFSKENHLFINYEELNTNYLYRDSIYHKHKKDKKYLKKHPNSILPNSVFLFEILDVNKNISKIEMLTNKKQLEKNNKILNILKLRNREITLYTETNRLRVYKITNKQNSSNINNMLFYDKRS